MKYLSYAFLALLTAFPFGSRASIASKLNDLEDCRVAITNAIVAKGGTASGALTNAAAEIAALPSGGGGRNWRGYKPPDDWPDIPQILEDNKEDGYQYAMAFLMDPSQTEVMLTGAEKFKCSDGFTTTSSTTHTWTDTGYHWCVALSNNRLFSTGGRTWSGLSGMGAKAKTLLVYGDGNAYLRMQYWENFVDLGGVGNKILKCLLVDFLYYNEDCWAFRGMQSLEYIKGKIYFNSSSPVCRFSQIFSDDGALRFIDLDLQATPSSYTSHGNNPFAGLTALEKISSSYKIGGGFSSMESCFQNNYALREMMLPFDSSSATSVQNLFNRCYNLQRVTNEIDLSRCTNVGNMFNECYSLVSLPTNMTLNISLNFATCTGVTDKNSVATFDAGGNVVGGFVGNLRSWDGTQYVDACPNSGQTITLNSAIKALFTSTEQSAIVAALTAKNWTLAW